MHRKTTSFLVAPVLAALLAAPLDGGAQALDQVPLAPVPLDRVDRMIVKFKGTAVSTTGVRIKSASAGPLATTRPRPMDEHDGGRGDPDPQSGGEVTDQGGTTGDVSSVVTPAETVRAVTELAGRAAVALEVVREASGASVVVALPTAVDQGEARALARRLAADPQVEYAVPDVRIEPKFSNDTLVSQQWNLTEPGAWYGSFGGSAGGMNAVKLWSTTQGQTGAGVPIRVAVIDTGGTTHPDVHAFGWLGQYDFVGADPNSNPATYTGAADGDGRDASANDPGDWCQQGSASSWHGTSVAAIIAATGGNGIGIIGAAPQSEVLQVRALGRCGGYISDIVDAMRWSAGLPVPGVPLNPTPAKVINLSLGTAWDYQCSVFEQAAVDEIVAQGALLVAAAGNEGGSAGYPQAGGAMGAPANCNGVLAVAAHTASGDLASYSNFDARVGLTAPGGGSCKVQGGACQAQGITTATNAGQQGPGAPSYRQNFAGTSAATPHAAAAAALLFAVAPQAAPQDVVNSLKSTARPWPQGSFCAGAAGAGLCGAGMLDVFAAAQHLSVAPIVQVTPPPSFLPGSSQLDVVATATSSVYAPGQLVYAWTQLSGLPATLADPAASTLHLTLPAVRTTVKLRLRVTDPAGNHTDANVVVEVNNPPVPNPMQPVSAGVGNTVSVQLGATDPDGDPIDFTLLQGSQGMAVDLQTGVLSWTPSAAGSYQVKVAVSDPYGATGQNIEFPVEVSQSGEGGGGGGGAVGWIESLALLLGLGWMQRRRQAAVRAVPIRRR
ncbi:MAG: S8 family serine peptidase [Lautropia sp.]